jgi:hypothetical protein
MGIDLAAPRAGVARTGSLLLLVAALVLAGCGGAARRAEDPGAPVDGAPAVQDVRWSEAPDTRVPINTIPWCADSSGHSAVYPCKGDARGRPPSPAWDAQAAPVAIWVTRGHGCGSLIGRVKTSEDNSVAWACYFAPGS